MAYTVPTVEPTTVRVGDTWHWDATYSDFPADEGWELSYRLRGPNDADFDFGSEVTAASSGPTFEVRIPAATTAAIDVFATQALPHMLIGRVTKTGAETLVVYNRPLLVHPDPNTPVLAKSHNRQMLEALRTALLTAATESAYLSVEVNGRSVTYARNAAQAELARYELLVALEENPHGSLSHAAEFVHG